MVMCPECDAKSHVQETRGHWRTRVCANGHRFRTVELTLPSIQDILAWRSYSEKLHAAVSDLWGLLRLPGRPDTPQMQVPNELAGGLALDYEPEGGA